MTVEEARQIINEVREVADSDEEQFFLLTEALQFLIEEEHQPDTMMFLGGLYYERRSFDLALKYYEMAAAYNSDAADECLGYIWYYGRTGERDFKKAFTHFSRAMERGNLVGAYKVADMYKNGYGVEKDYDKYVSVIEDLYLQVKEARNVFAPLPEIFTRLARIRTEQGKTDEAVNLYFRAKNFLAQRIRHNAFFGNLNIMKWLIDDLYELIEFDKDEFDFYDSLYLLKAPVKIKFMYKAKQQNLEALMEDDVCVIKFNDKWYPDRDAFLSKAQIGEDKLTVIYGALDDFEVIE